MKHIAVIVPVYNEAEMVSLFYAHIMPVLEGLPYRFTLTFVNDGSRDATEACILGLAAQDGRIRYIEFSRNFGKEAATTAGLHAADGDAALLIDADLQHPVELIPRFIEHWEHGAQIVVGVRAKSESDSFVKRAGSRLFYRLMRLVSDTDLIPSATDFRLVDRAVVNEFNRFTEHERLTRGLIDWLGFRIALVPFAAKERLRGEASYSLRKLIRLGITSITSHSLVPLRLAGYLGASITIISLPIGLVMFVDRFVYPLGFDFSGPAILGDILLFLVGIVLICLGMLAVYVGHIFEETRNRPLYVVSRRVNLD
jgi:dolichol-phosphate mannosyltransferase